MPKGFEFERKKFKPSGWSPSGGGPTGVGSLAGNSPYIDNFAGIRAKSSGVNDIPTTGVVLKAQEKATQLMADAQVQAARYGADATRAMAAMEAQSIMQNGLLSLQQSRYNARQAREQAGRANTMGWVNMGVGLLKTAAPYLLASDEKTKHTVNQLQSGLEILRQLRPVSFYYKDEYTDMPNRKHYGFIAQEYQEHMPDATYTAEGSGLLCIDTMELIALLVRANQELEARVARLEVSNVLAEVGK